MQCRNQKREMSTISDVISQLQQTSNKRSEGILPILKEKWSEIVGQSLVTISKPIAIYYNVLIIELENNHWQKIWEDHRLDLLQKINKLYPWMNIKDLRLVYTGQQNNYRHHRKPF